MKTFLDHVDDLAKDKSKNTLSHSGPEESALVMGTIFKYAEDYVKMYVGNFNGKVSNHPYYSDGVKNYLQKGGKLDVIVSKTLPVRSEVYKRISLYAGFRENVRIVENPDTLFKVFFDEDKENMKSIHFAVADDRMFRLEIDTENYSGIACFNDTDLAVRISSMFDKEFEKSLRTHN